MKWSIFLALVCVLSLGGVSLGTSPRETPGWAKVFATVWVTVAQAQEDSESDIDENLELDEFEEDLGEDFEEEGDFEDIGAADEDESTEDPLNVFEEESEREGETDTELVSAEGDDGGEEELTEGEREASPVEAPLVVEEDPLAAPVTDLVTEVPVEEVSAVESQEAVIPDKVLGERSNSSYERRLFEIYQDFNQNRVSSEQWDEMLGSRQAETYSVQRGDTLWGISEMLFGDGHFWPKVWSFNRSISNPHVIEVGETLRFMAGDAENAPRVLVGQTLSNEVSAPSGTLEIPPPAQFFRPPLTFLPPSLPPERRRLSPEFDDSGFAVATKTRRKAVATMSLTSFLSESYPSVLGQVQEIEGGRQRARAFDYIYVQLDEPRQGAVYTVISAPGASVGGRELEVSSGVAVDYQGEIKVEEVVNDELGLVRALVLSVVNPIAIGGRVVDGRIPRVQVSQQGRLSSVRAQVVGGEFDRDRGVLGVGAVVYLDAGESQDVAVGDILAVFANEALRNQETLIRVNQRSIGKVKVVKTGDSVSTGVVVYANEQISTGDVTGKVVSSQFNARGGTSREESLEGDESGEFNDLEEDEGFLADELSEDEELGGEEEDLDDLEASESIEEADLEEEFEEEE